VVCGMAFSWVGFVVGVVVVSRLAAGGEDWAGD
jgi:hypothetical protein